MDHTPRVTIVMPVYNQSAFIATALDSILAQNYSNLQLIISDDASTDDTVAIVRHYQTRYPQIELQCHSKNLGVTDNAISAYPLIAGDYICWFAGDDIMLPGKITQQVAAMKSNPRAVMCYHEVDVFDSITDRHLYYYNRDTGLTPFAGIITNQLLQYRCFIAGISIMIHRDAHQKLAHRAEIGVCSDWFFFIELSMLGETIYLPAVLARYRRHAANLTNAIIPAREEIVFTRMLELYPDYQQAVELGRARFYVMIAIKAMLAGYFSVAATQVKKLFTLIQSRPAVLGFVMTSVLTQCYVRFRLFCVARWRLQRNL